MNGTMVALDGSVLTPDVGRWFEGPSPEEHRILRRIGGPVLDIGCGPGRHVGALGERGVAALGVDVAPAAVALARRRGATVLRRSVFDPLPGAGRWRGALLLDGNIGIGGDPLRLLRRVRELLRFDGELFAEVAPPMQRSSTTWARIEANAGSTPWFPWARVGAGDVRELAANAGFARVETWTAERRWFVKLCAA
ncbi:MAG TPA: methyltransferase domain-containing protein [Actinomycetota bacterium]|nr:methyltransferase domain-containing protein [Actinomycetota bacterium]